MTIRPLTSDDIDKASQLIEQAVKEYGQADFSALGYSKFKSTVLNDGMRKNMREGFLYWGALDDTTLVGMIAIKPPAHLFNLFVHVQHHRKGIALKLWRHVLSQLKPKSVTVFSSSYAVEVYRKLGFEINGEKIANEEVICYPMLWKSENNS